MTHICVGRHTLPVAAPALKQSAHLNVEISRHAAMIAKFCAVRKQPIAPKARNALLMEAKSINEVVADALAWHMKQAKTTAKALGEAAGVSPRTVGNFLKPDGRVSGDRGKEPSGKLTELALIADALGVTVADLVSPMTPEQREERRRLQLAAHLLKTGEIPPAALDSEQPKRSSGKRHRIAA